MNEIEKSAFRNINELVQKLSQNNYKTTEPKKEGFAFSIEVLKHSENVKILVYFGKKGIKTVIQGNSEQEIYNNVKELIFGKELFDNIDTSVEEPNQYIGIDESGKGDYFGPLIVAGVFVNERTKKLLKDLDVRDSKELNDKLIKVISKKIKIALGESFDVVSIFPEKYNLLYDKFGNLNRLLAWAHSRVLENLILKTDAKEAISDKFGNEKLIQNSLMEKGRQVILHQYHKAERYTAVAAASILAREKVIDWFHQKNKEFGFPLPKGASTNVNETASVLKHKLTKEEFNKLVKLHFKNSKLIA